MSAAPNAPAAIRNRGAILQVLQKELRGCSRVLEIGSGTGQHAVYFGAALPHLSWQTSDRAPNHDGIRQWIDAAGLSNVLVPLQLDVTGAVNVASDFDAVFSANTAHIMSETAVAAMVRLVAQLLNPGGQFLLYGPFRVGGQHTSASNNQFDCSLRKGDTSMGVRELEWIDDLAEKQGLVQASRYTMPSNNMLVVWRKRNEELENDNP